MARIQYLVSFIMLAIVLMLQSCVIHDSFMYQERITWIDVSPIKIYTLLWNRNTWNKALKYIFVLLTYKSFWTLLISMAFYPRNWFSFPDGSWHWTVILELRIFNKFGYMSCIIVYFPTNITLLTFLFSLNMF